MDKLKFLVKRFSYTHELESFINSFTYDHNVQDIQIAAIHEGACKEIIIIIKYLEK